MAYKVVPDRQGVINIGKIKENLVTEVELPAPGFGGGSYAVLLRRPKEEQPYPVTARYEGGSLVWTVQTADTAIAGTGKLECRWYGDNGEVAKSQTYMVRITDGLPDPTEAPEAWEGYIGQVARNAQAAQTAAGEAKANAAGAAASAGIAQGAAAEAGKLAGTAGDAANAAASAASAASSAQAGAETAGQNARAAAEAAETAQSGAEAAKLAAGESATAAAGSAETAAQAAQKGESLYNQVKDDLAAGKLKGEKGEKGDPGKDAPQIDDAVISAENPWSSKKIVETLCPPLDVSGNPVVCYPVAGYPLGVVASWEPTQEGSGDPSPDNVRPIKGRDSVTVERCGGNVIEFLSTNDFNSGIKIAVDAEKNITLNGTTVEKSNIVIGMCRLHWVAGKTYTMYVKKVGGSASLGSDDGITFAYSLFTTDYNHFFRGDTNSKNLDAYIASNAALAETEIVFMLQCWRVNTVFNNFKFRIEVVEGTTPPTVYTPYRGDTLDLQLPGTVYGGSVDAVSGQGQNAWKLLTLDGDETWYTWGVHANNATVTVFFTYDISDYDVQSIAVVCSNLPFSPDAWGGRKVGIGFATDGQSRYFIYSVPSVILDDISDNAHAIASLKSYLAAQAAAGTPVQIAYKLAEPVPFAATGAQPIPALAGTNTVMTDADSVTITGRADPAHAIAALQAQLATATQQLAETQAAVVDTTAMTVDYIYEQDSKIFGGDDDDNETDTEPVDVPGV